MNTSRRLLLSLVFLTVPLLGGSIVTTYTDQTAFLTAVQAIPNATTELETFNANTLTAPGLSVQTVSGLGPSGPSVGYGHIANGAWVDCLGRPCDEHYNDTTTWNFAHPTYAFGATFTYTSGFAPGISLNDVKAPEADGFFGFISDTPFSSVLVWDGPGQQTDPRGQSYTMDNLYLEVADSAAPEPATWSLLGLAALCAVAMRRLAAKPSKPHC